MVRRSYFEDIRGFDSRLPLGYEDAEICWRAWAHGWKIVYVPEAVCWHRVGSSAKSLEGARYNFRGVLTGRLVFATKLLPWNYGLKTWLISTAGLAKDLAGPRRRFVGDRLRILLGCGRLIPALLKEKDVLFSRGGITCEEHLARMLKLSSESNPT
jgi:GT2 family glycosyltransferase